MTLRSAVFGAVAASTAVRKRRFLHFSDCGSKRTPGSQISCSLPNSIVEAISPCVGRVRLEVVCGSYPATQFESTFASCFMDSLRSGRHLEHDAEHSSRKLKFEFLMSHTLSARGQKRKNNGHVFMVSNAAYIICLLKNFRWLSRSRPGCCNQRVCPCNRAKLSACLVISDVGVASHMIDPKS